MATTDPVLQPGTKLYHGSYRIISTIGRGGFGITYLAVNENLGNRLAIKEFFPKGLYNRDDDSLSASVASQDNAEMSDRFKAKFVKEARRLAGLSHDSIVSVNNAFEENGTAYYVMDFIEGESLHDMVKKHGPLPLDRAVHYITQVGEALEYIHSLRINHLDVKPANILVNSKNDRAVLIDFGLSKQYDSNDQQTSTTPVGMSHGYAPAEQYKSGGVGDFSASTDVYSLGATLYYLLEGVRPPEAADLMDEDLVFSADVPAGIRSVIRRAMAFRRADRYQSVADFLRALKSAMAGDDEDTDFGAAKENVDATDLGTAVNQKSRPVSQAVAVKASVAEKPAPARPSPEQSVEKKVASNSRRRSWIFILAGILLIAGIAIGVPMALNNKASLSTVFHFDPLNLDLQVDWHGHIGYISENDWERLSPEQKGEVEEKGLYVTGDGEQFIIALSNLTEEVFVWDEAMRRSDGHLPDKEQSDVMCKQHEAINQALGVYGGDGMNGWFWTATSQSNSVAWAFNMIDGASTCFAKTDGSAARIVVSPLSSYEDMADEVVDEASQPAEEEERITLKSALHFAPNNLDLCVIWNGRTRYISENDWEKLTANQIDALQKEGLYLSGDGEQFILELKDFTEDRLGWDEAMTRTGGKMPTLAQAEILYKEKFAINRALQTYGGEVMDAFYWTSNESTDYNTNSWFVSMLSSGGFTVSRHAKKDPLRVRTVKPVP